MSKPPDYKKTTRILNSICVYSGSADGLSQEYLNAAFEMGRILAQSGICLVYGAGKTGMMGAVAEGALQAGGEVIGVVPASLKSPRICTPAKRV
jgi:uncharacterized protein (TIGR00730 family)